MSAKRKQRDPEEKTKWGHKRTYTIPSNSERRLMSTLISCFLHQDDVSTVNGKSGEIWKKGQIFRKRALKDTMAFCLKIKGTAFPRLSSSNSSLFGLAREECLIENVCLQKTQKLWPENKEVASALRD